MGKKTVRRPRVDLDARGFIDTHGLHTPVRGVWHDTESHDYAGLRDLEAIVHFWKEQDFGYGAHLIIDAEGNSALCADPQKICWAVENRNTGTLSVELVGFARFTPSLWWARQAQLDKLARWMAWFNLEYHVPLVADVDKGWSGHIDQTKKYGGSHTDPGRFFPRGYVLRKANLYRFTGWA